MSERLASARLLRCVEDNASNRFAAGIRCHGSDKYRLASASSENSQRDGELAPPRKQAGLLNSVVFYADLAVIQHLHGAASVDL